MLNAIRATSLEVRKPQEVSLRKDAARNYGQSEAQTNAEASVRGAVVSVGQQARDLANEQRSGGGGSAQQLELFESNPPSPRGDAVRATQVRPQGTADAPLGKLSSDFSELLTRTLAQGAATIVSQGTSGDTAPASGRVTAQRREVPFTTDTPGSADADGGRVPLPFAQSVPFDLLQRAAAGEVLGNTPAGTPEQISFELPEEPGAPFGRNIPFDLQSPEGEQSSPSFETGDRSAPNVEPGELSPAEQRQVRELERRDQDVRREQQRTQAAAGALGGEVRVDYRSGPDGRRYAVAGSVSLDTTPVAGDAEATARKMSAVERAARLAGSATGEGRQVATEASSAVRRAQAELANERYRSVDDEPLQVPDPGARGQALASKAQLDFGVSLTV